MPGSGSKDLYIANSVSALNKMVETDLSTANTRVIVNAAQQLFIKATQAYSDKDEERSYILYMRYFNVIQHVKKSAEYNKNQQYFDDLLGSKKFFRQLLLEPKSFVQV